MADTNIPSTEHSIPSSPIAKDDANERASNPKRHYQSPEMLMQDDGLTDDEKYELLSEWHLELDNRLNAESEGMSASDPMRQSKEGSLADEAARVQSLVSELGKRLGKL